MQTIYQEKNVINRAYRPLSRYLKIRYTTGGDPFVRFRNARIRFDGILSLPCPILPLDEDGRPFVIGGYYPISNCFGYLLEIHPDGEAARFWEEVSI